MVQWSDGMCGAVMRRGWLWGWYSSGHSDPGSGAGIIITLTTHNHVSEITNRKPPALHSAQVWSCGDISEFLSSLCVVSLFEADFEFILSQINQTNNFVLIGNYWGWWPVYPPRPPLPSCVIALLIVSALLCLLLWSALHQQSWELKHSNLVIFFVLRIRGQSTGNIQQLNTDPEITKYFKYWNMLFTPN